ncbi:type II secretion system inner membrane protein GspF [Steroidobacter sp. S1-65]|uniref:Type II secretion system inner membrane protein GspF n=1 Tax=Steroidobacter gossypii TaxID=2805490 RepID=A0ABS1WZQ0_9GAMM|nr:type II secretion system inner membrane protein GspF [Steroidobacter gossypii]MBM0106407.1 type II secretion system inner membrane protein GspF [Steroidobacter gossypii]
MGAFEYTAVDASGRERKGVLEGDTARQVRQLLRDQALLPLAVNEVSQSEQKQRESRFTLKRGVSAADLALLTRQIATLVRSGLPLEEALAAVSEQTEKPRVRSIVMGVRAKVMEGHTLADGLSDFPTVFPELYIATVAAGEQSGHLDTVLERLADYTENREQLRSRTVNAMLYPVLLFIVCISIVALLLTFVVPKIVKQFENSKAELPMLTQVLIAISDFLRDWGWLVVVGLVLAVLGFRRWLRDPNARRRFHAALLRLPLFGKVVRGSNTARFARTFSTLTSSAVPVLEALRISGEVVTNLPMRDAVQDAATRVREGAPIGKSLGSAKIFPPMMIHLISSGESSGELETMLDRAATNQEREMDSILSAAVGLLGPLMILFMGGMVLLIVLAMLLPIFQLNTLIR